MSARVKYGIVSSIFQVTVRITGEEQELLYDSSIQSYRRDNRVIAFLYRSVRSGKKYGALQRNHSALQERAGSEFPDHCAGSVYDADADGPGDDASL